jgi:hypothetical protein
MLNSYEAFWTPPPASAPIFGTLRGVSRGAGEVSFWGPEMKPDDTQIRLSPLEPETAPPPKRDDAQLNGCVSRPRRIYNLQVAYEYDKAT